MSGSKYEVVHGVEFEHVGDELLVYVPGRTEVLKLSGEAAEVFLDIRAGKTPLASGEVFQDLESLRIIHNAGLSRRGLIKAGAIGAGSGIAVMAMPGVAAASSSFVFEGNGGWYWEWSLTDQLQLVFYVEPGFAAGSIGNLVISEAIPTPANASLTAPQTIPLDTFDATFVAWGVRGLDDTGVTDGNLTGVYSSLTGTFTVSGQGTFTATFDNEN